MVEDETSNQIKEFKNTAQSSFLVLEKIKEAKSLITNSMKSYGDGIIDGVSLICEIFDLDPDDIDPEVAQAMLNQKEIRKFELAKLKIINGNGEKKRFSFKKVKSKESEQALQ